MRLLESQLYYCDLQTAIKKYDFSYLNNSRILVTGGMGLIGSAIVDAIYVCCAENGYSIQTYVAGRDKGTFTQRYGQYENIFFIPYDVMEPKEFEVQFDYIIYAAGIASPELYVSKPVETMLSNISGIINLLEISRRQNVKRLLYISSSEVYGKKETEAPYTEGTYGLIDIDDLRSSYPIAKRTSEMLCKSYTSEYGIDTVILRPGHVYGPSATQKDKRVSSDFAIKAANGIDLEMRSSGMQKRSYVYSVDCAMSILIALSDGIPGEAYNIANEEVVTIREMAHYYAEAGQVKLKIGNPTDEEIKAFNPMNNSSLDGQKIHKIGYKQTFSPKEGFMHTVKILQEIAK